MDCATPDAEPDAPEIRPARLSRGHREDAPRGVSAARLPRRFLDRPASAGAPRSSRYRVSRRRPANVLGLRRTWQTRRLADDGPLHDGPGARCALSGHRFTARRRFRRRRACRLGPFRRSALRSVGSVPRRVASCWSPFRDIRAAAGRKSRHRRSERGESRGRRLRCHPRRTDAQSRSHDWTHHRHDRPALP